MLVTSSIQSMSASTCTEITLSFLKLSQYQGKNVMILASQVLPLTGPIASYLLLYFYSDKIKIPPASQESHIWQVPGILDHVQSLCLVFQALGSLQVTLLFLMHWFVCSWGMPSVAC